MEILDGHRLKEIMEFEVLVKRGLHDQLSTLGAHAHLGFSTKTNLLSQTSRKPLAKAVFHVWTRVCRRDPRLHINVYPFWSVCSLRAFISLVLNLLVRWHCGDALQ